MTSVGWLVTMCFMIPWGGVSAGPRFIWHRAWGMSQDAKKGKRPKSMAQVLGVACTEDYCNYSTKHKCNLDCIIPQHGCRQMCDQNAARDGRDYICPDGIVFGKGGRRGAPTCFPNGYPTTDSKPDGCCTYFQCEGTGQGMCDPREIFEKCQAESASGSNAKLTGCLKRVNKDMGALPSIFQKFLAHSGGDMGTPLPSSDRRRGGRAPSGGGGGGGGQSPPDTTRRRRRRRRSAGALSRRRRRRRSDRRRRRSDRRRRRRSDRRRSASEVGEQEPFPSPSPSPSPSPPPSPPPSPRPAGQDEKKMEKKAKKKPSKDAKKAAKKANKRGSS